MLPSIVIFFDCRVMALLLAPAAELASSAAAAACKDSKVTTGRIGALLRNHGCSHISCNCILCAGLGLSSLEIKSFAT